MPHPGGSGNGGKTATTTLKSRRTDESFEVPDSEPEREVERQRQDKIKALKKDLFPTTASFQDDLNLFGRKTPPHSPSPTTSHALDPHSSEEDVPWIPPLSRKMKPTKKRFDPTTPTRERVSRYIDGPGSSEEEEDILAAGYVARFPPFITGRGSPFTPVRKGRPLQREVSISSDRSPSPPPTASPPPKRGSRSPKKKHVTSPSKRSKQPDDWRVQFTKNLFEEFRREIFEGLPDVDIYWNNHLRTTSGRAVYYKNHETGEHDLTIQLATKILDCEERIRFTLAHEMCHMATWLVTGQLEQGHGEHFMRWADYVMTVRPDVIISFRHNYTIDHPWVWKCKECDQEYGRFTNSLDPEWICCSRPVQGGKCMGILSLSKHPANYMPKASTKTIMDSREATSKPQASGLQCKKRAASLGDEFVDDIEAFALTASFHDLNLTTD